MKKGFVVMTSINPPTEAVRRFAELEDWQLVVAGDTKTPRDWSHPNVAYLSPEDQKSMISGLIHKLPWKSYSRKMAGYVYAIERGAQLIADTDDDNIPYSDWGKDLPERGLDVLDGKGFANIYSLFTPEHVWPRGFPLTEVLRDRKDVTRKDHGDTVRVGVWQFLADEDPDVDAIYRLTCNKPIYFQKRSAVVLERGIVCPFNSQNTVFARAAFPLLYLPVYVNFRFTDILRGLVAQPVLWAAGYRLCFGGATVIQKRNPHDYLADFESELPCYLHPQRILECVEATVSDEKSVAENLRSAYRMLVGQKIVEERELELLDEWLNVCGRTGSLRAQSSMVGD